MSIIFVLFSGMPMYKNPFEKGQLIVQFLVNFPTSIPPEVIPALENCLPPRPMVRSFCMQWIFQHSEITRIPTRPELSRNN